MYKVIKYQHPINLDGQCLPLCIFSNKKDLVGKIVTITLSSNKEEKIDVNDDDIISKHTQHVYARRKEEIFVKIINVYRGYNVKAEIIDNALSNTNMNVLFFVHDTKSTAFFAHSKHIAKVLNDKITMNSDLISYFKSTSYSNELGEEYTDDDGDWIDQSLLNRIDKNPTEHDLHALNYLLKENIICQDLYNKYVYDYIPLNNMYQTILGIFSARKLLQYETNPYDPQFDQHDNCIFKRYASYGHDNNNFESRFLKSGDLIYINLENIHYIPLDMNNMNDYPKYEYKFAKIPTPMSWSGALFEDRDAILSSLKVGNTVRCIFKKTLIDGDKANNVGGPWYFNIIQILDNIIYGSLKDPYNNPDDHNLNEGDILVFNKDNITEIPHTWESNDNLKHFNTLNVGYFTTGYVCQVDSVPEEDSSKNDGQSDER